MKTFTRDEIAAAFKDAAAMTPDGGSELFDAWGIDFDGFQEVVLAFVTTLLSVTKNLLIDSPQSYACTLIQTGFEVGYLTRLRQELESQNGND